MIHSHCKLFIASILLQLFQKVEEELAVETIYYGSPKYSKISATRDGVVHAGREKGLSLL